MTPEPDRGEKYADGGFEDTHNVHYPDPARMARIADEWARQGVTINWTTLPEEDEL